MPAPPSMLSGRTALADWSVLFADGPDAAAFLHGQLTQDIQGLDAAAARLAGYCSPKGRLLASFIVWRPEPEHVVLACHRSVAAAALKRLSMFVLRAKCRLHDATAQAPLVGLYGTAASETVGDAAVWSRSDSSGTPTIRLPDAAGLHRAIQVVAPEASGVGPAPSADAQATWRWLEVESGIATISSSTADQWVPQMINYEQVGGVNFQKGCYPGQEVVARSQYRGTVKRRAMLFHVDAPAAPGDLVCPDDPAAEPAGMVVDAAPAPDGGPVSALVEVRLAAVESGPLHLHRPDGPVLTPQVLPYPLVA